MIDAAEIVNGTAYMDFREATDTLFNRVDHETLAKKLGVSVASIRQARLGPNSKAHRQPPPNWTDATIRLAEEQIHRYERLIADLKPRRTEPQSKT
jgi:hypothetical protein